MVEKDSSVSNIQVSSKKGWGLDEEALRLAFAMPKWIPAIHNGKVVRSTVNLPIPFKLSNSFEGYIADEQIYSSCEDMPAMIGETIYEYLNKALIYPKKEKKAGIEGRVVVQFTVNEHGVIYDTEIIKSANPNFDKAVLKVINKMPYWKPATIKGRPVKFRYTLPVKFKL
ncbi:MAG: TonB family protein [Bacteroidetes bacterium]|nr:MAG: TonB family protein [Bacteroidota bacterium]